MADNFQILTKSYMSTGALREGTIPPLSTVALRILVMIKNLLDMKHAVPLKISICLMRIESTTPVRPLSRLIYRKLDGFRIIYQGKGMPFGRTIHITQN